MPSDTSTALNPSLEELQELIAPHNIAYYDLSGALPTRAKQVCGIIAKVREPDVLQALLVHSQTLRAPQGKEFPIQRVRSAIVSRLAELGV